MYKISIIIPAHNRPHSLKMIIKKFLNIKNVELIIVENGSTEINKKKYKILEETLKKFKNITFSFHLWASHTKARFLGAKLSNSKYVFNCDDDDMPTDEFIDWINQNEMSLSLYRFNLWIKNKKTKKYNNPIPQSNIVKYIMQVSTWIIKKEVLLTVYKKLEIPYNLVLGEDQILSIGIYEWLNSKKYKIKNLDVCSIYYDYNFNIPKIGILSGERKKSTFSNDKIIFDYLLKHHDLSNPFWYKTFRKITNHFKKYHIKEYADKKNAKNELKKYKRKIKCFISN